MNRPSTIPFLAVVPFLMMLYGCEDGTSDNWAGPGVPPLPSTAIKLYSAELQALEAGRDADVTYSPYMARVVGRVYHHASPLFDDRDVRVFVRENRAIFSRDGAFVGCARTLGNVLVNQAIGAFKPGDYDTAYGRALEMGTTGEQARGVADQYGSCRPEPTPRSEMEVWKQEIKFSAKSISENRRSVFPCCTYGIRIGVL